jgi:hypothetical protein
VLKRLINNFNEEVTFAFPLLPQGITEQKALLHGMSKTYCDSLF